MLVKFLCFILSITFTQGSTYATNFDCALDDSPESIMSVRRAVVKPLPIDTSNAGKIIISVNYPGCLDYTSENVPQRFNIAGRLPRGVINFLDEHKNQYLQNISRAINQEITSTEFVFTGYGHGGKIALALSALWANEYNRISNRRPEQNQIKSITFSASSFGDEQFNRFMARLLGETNILDFSSYCTRSIQCGVPIRVLPDEQFIDTLRNTSYNSIIKVGAALSFLTWSYFVLNDLVNTSDNFINTSAGVISSSQNYSFTSNYINSRDNFIGARDRTKSFILAYTFSLLTLGAYDIYKNYKFIPSERLLLEAFRYTQGNYHSDEEASIYSIGQPPLISTRRGVGKFLRWLTGV